MKSLMEIYTLQIKLLAGLKAEILQKHLSMRSFMGQVTKNSEVSGGRSQEYGGKIKERFLKSLPSLKRLRDRVDLRL